MVRSFLRGPLGLVIMLTPSPAYRGHARVFLKDLEAIRPSAIIDIIHSGESFVLEQSVQKGMKAMREFGRSLNIAISALLWAARLTESETCLRCGYMSSNDLCKACALLQGLEAGLDRSALVRRSAITLQPLGIIASSQ
jgi:cytoplasmic tRNA 2-thiolation protein 1